MRRQGFLARNRQDVVTTPLPDEYSLMVNQTLAITSNTLSPMSRGTITRSYVGVPGFGVNRFAGKLATAVQNIHGVASPIHYPQRVNVGVGSGVSGQPGMPSTSGTSPLTGVSAVLASTMGMGGS